MSNKLTIEEAKQLKQVCEKRIAELVQALRSAQDMWCMR